MARRSQGRRGKVSEAPAWMVMEKILMNWTWFRWSQPLSESPDHANRYDPALATQHKSSLTCSRRPLSTTVDKRLERLEVISGHYQPVSTPRHTCWPKAHPHILAWINESIEQEYQWNIGSVMMRAISHIDLNTTYTESFVLYSHSNFS